MESAKRLDLADCEKLYSRRRWLKWLLASLLTSLLLQGIAVASLGPVTPDSREYLALSRNLFYAHRYSYDGLTPTRMRMPLYPLFLVATYWAAGQHLLLVQLSQVIMNMAVLYLAFLIARQVFGQELWPGTVLMLGLYLPLWTKSAYILTETLFALLVALFMFSLLQWLKGQSPPLLRGGLIPGALLGLAILTRPIGFSILPVSLLPIALRTRSYRRALSSWTVLCMGCALVLLPWAARNLIALGEFTPLSTDGASNLFFASLPDEVDLETWQQVPQFQACAQKSYYLEKAAYECFLAQAGQNIRQDPVSYLLRGIKRAGWVWCFFSTSQRLQGIPFLFWPFGVGTQMALLVSALVGLRGIKKRWAALLLVSPALAFTGAMFFTRAETRFTVPAMLYLVMLSGQGVRTILQQLQPRMPRLSHLDSWWPFGKS